MTTDHTPRPFGWFDIVRLGLVQACLGSMVVVATSTLNRIMVVELALPALLPGLLVGLHYAVQLVRPRMGFGADQGRRCTPWMMAGVVTLALGGNLAAWGTTWMARDFTQGLWMCMCAFALIGVGVSACGTSLLALMAKRVPQEMRAPAATTVWVMMIIGFALTAVSVGKLIEPYSPARLLEVTVGLGVVICVITALAIWRLETPTTTPIAEAHQLASANEEGVGQQARDFKRALAEVWSQPQARMFTLFVFLSMLAYSLQDLILEPFAGAIFGMSPGQSTQLSGLHHSGVLVGMLAVAVAGSKWVAGRLGSVQTWMVAGCLFSAVAMTGLTTAGLQGAPWPLKPNVWFLGCANGVFSIAAIATMMRLANAGGGQSQGTRMGLWGAAQAMAFGLGGVLGTALSDLAHWIAPTSGLAYAAVFALEGCMFIASALCAVWVGRLDEAGNPTRAQETAWTADNHPGRTGQLTEWQS